MSTRDSLYRLSQLAGIHRGNMAFILGAGPSLHSVSAEALKPHVTFAVNAAILKMPNADYFVSDDAGISDWDWFYDVLPKSTTTALWYGDKLDRWSKFLPQERVCLFQHKIWHDTNTGIKDPEGLKIGANPDDPIIGARTSSGTAVHLAHILGCDPIVLLGMDCCYQDTNQYFWQYPGERQPKRIKGAVIPRRLMKHKGVTIDNHNWEFIEYWNALSEANPHLNIIDCSEKGILTCFPKMMLRDVLNQYAPRTK